MCLRSMKGKFIFVTGFFIGFFLTILLIPINNYHGSTSSNERKPFGAWNHITSDYRKWILENGVESSFAKNVQSRYQSFLKSNKIKSKNVDMDVRRYKPNDSEETSQTLTEADWLRSKVHVTCVVFVEKIKLAKSIKDTWGLRCNDIYFFHLTLEDSSVPVIKVTKDKKLTSSWEMLCDIMHFVWNATELEQKSLEWIIFVKDDTIVLPENLRYFVTHLNYNQNHYLGHPVILWGQAYNVAQAGYVLSKGAFQKIIKSFDTTDKCISGGKYWKKDDYYLGKNLAALNIYPSDMRDHRQRGTFHGYSLQILLWGIAKPGSYFTRALYPPGAECCSPRSVTFSVSEPDKLYTLNYILYRLNVNLQMELNGNRLASTAMPDNEVWRQALKDEFNLTDVAEMSNEEFYNTWKSRYSEPSQFINRNYQNIPGVLDSILTVYESDKKTAQKQITQS